MKIIWKNTMLFNVAELDERPGGIVHMRRFPKNVQDAFGGGQSHFNKYIARMTTGCEIRFVSDRAAVTLSAWDADGVVEIYKGDYFVKTCSIPRGQLTTLMIGDSVMTDTHDMRSYRGRYDPCVWRIVFAHDFCGVLHDVDPIMPVRPPASDELPAKIMLAYGSSITHGACSMLHSNAYIARTAQALGMDILNKGMGGSCYCEKEVADYIAQANWDVAILELAVNMLNIFSPEVYEERAGYVLEQALSTGKPVVFISHFRHFRDLPDHNREQIAINAAYLEKAEILRRRYDCPNLIYIDGREILDDYNLLTADLIHLSVYGHSVIGERLAQKLKTNEKIKKLINK